MNKTHLKQWILSFLVISGLSTHKTCSKHTRYKFTTEESEYGTLDTQTTIYLIEFWYFVGLYDIARETDELTTERRVDLFQVSSV